ncbi:MAG: helix-turn-helix domain-containing protein [Methanoregulaceae archaeon]|nr:helix-turn-helix domain-containing protein [Methanoregulaceae archaeon]MCC7469520.1 helix-turn-helix domain-containing protein [Burkholderiaceae bacterium]NLH26733.1 hypothetical protein [Methanomicrobiales archaeon]
MSIPRPPRILPGPSRRGYFDHPWTINSSDLAEKMGMHKTPLLEHIPEQRSG